MYAHRASLSKKRGRSETPSLLWLLPYTGKPESSPAPREREREREAGRDRKKKKRLQKKNVTDNGIDANFNLQKKNVADNGTDANFKD